MGIHRISNHQPIARPSILSPFRYPGGKTWLRSRVIKWLKELGTPLDYFVEPFAGGGSVALAVAELNLADHIVMVELDPEVAALWRVILGGRAAELVARIRSFRLRRNAVIQTLADDNNDEVATAFRCLLKNRVHRGGILAPGAGLLKEGENGKGLSSRWYPETLAARIEKIQFFRGRISFSEGDALNTIALFAAEERAAFFIDPPYFANGRGPGQRLYRHNDVDHSNLFSALAKSRGPCLITYHNSRTIRVLAESHGFSCRNVRMKTTHHRIRNELLIFKPSKLKPASVQASILTF
jgi:DNA adenine methylase